MCVNVNLFYIPNTNKKKTFLKKVCWLVVKKLCLLEKKLFLVAFLTQYFKGKGTIPNPSS